MGEKTMRAKYPRQLTIMLSDELADRLERDAAAAGVSRGEVARLYLEEGIGAVEAADPDAD